MQTNIYDMQCTANATIFNGEEMMSYYFDIEINLLDLENRTSFLHYT